MYNSGRVEWVCGCGGDIFCCCCCCYFSIEPFLVIIFLREIELIITWSKTEIELIILWSKTLLKSKEIFPLEYYQAV